MILGIAFRRLRRKEIPPYLLDYFRIGEKNKNEILNVCLSLLIRSPSNRNRLEHSGRIFGLPREEEVAKLNMLSQVRGLRELVKSGFRSNLFPLIIYSYRKEFIFGDGMLDGITGGISNGQLRGSALVPLTPHVCIFLCSPFGVRQDRNAGILIAPEWMVEQINEITQIYSRDVLFYATKQPRLHANFKRQEFLTFKYHSNDLIFNLRDLCGEKRSLFRFHRPEE